MFRNSGFVSCSATIPTGLVFFLVRLNQYVTAAPLITETDRIRAIDGGRPAEKMSVSIASMINIINIRVNVVAGEPRIRADQAVMWELPQWFAAGRKLLPEPLSISLLCASILTTYKPSPSRLLI